jgi:hypothetical protein
MAQRIFKACPAYIYACYIISPQGFMISAHVRFAEQKIARALK